jgi:integrase
LEREFPHDRINAAREYLKELRDQGHPARLEQADEHWYVRIRQKGHPELAFDGGSYDSAQAAANRIEAERHQGLFLDYTKGHRAILADLIERYIQEVCPLHKGCAVETSILESLLWDLGGKYAARVEERKRARALAKVAGTNKKPRILPPRHESRDKELIAWLLLPIAQVVPKPINDYINDRLADVEPATVDREIDVLSQIISWCIKTERIHLHLSPLVGVNRPPYFNERDRRLTPKEEQQLREAAREEDRLLAPKLALDRFRAEIAAIPDVHASTRKRRLRALREQIACGAIPAPVIPYFETFIEFLLLTAARRSEALALKCADVNFEAASAYIPDSKNGRARNLMLRRPMIEALQRLPRLGERVFPFTLNDVRAAWERIRERAQLEDYLQHDLRHESLSRLCEVARAAGMPLTLHELATISGHRDFRCLARYLNLCTGELAHRIDEAHQIAAEKAAEAAKRNESARELHKGRPRPRMHVSAAAVAREAMRQTQPLSSDASPDEVLESPAANTLPV